MQRIRYTRPDAIATTRPTRPTCAFGACNEETFAGLPVCFMCGLMIGKFMDDLFECDRENPRYGPAKPPGPQPQAYVYYLMLSPTTVKIGTTRNLPDRLGALRSEAQYVVALERGSYELEHQRHREFENDRRKGRGEEFHLSDALKQHIDTLAPHRDELIIRASKRELSDAE